jgi:fermentation-respiration switch protein FrsA (DUF1100 family)
MAIFVKAIAALAVAYAAVLGLVYLFQSRLVYFPTTGNYSVTPQVHGLDFEVVQIATADGEQLAAWWIPAPTPALARGTVLLLHGNAGDISHRIDYALMFFGLGYNTLLVDYRGYGKSTGTPSEEGTYRDAEAGWQWLTGKRGIKASEIVVFGESLGGGAASWLAAQHAPGVLVLASTFTSIPDLGAGVYPWLPVRWLARIHYNNLANLERLRAPLLIAHSRDDDIIPFAHGERLYAAAREPKAFLTLSGGHNEGFVFARADWVKALAAFLEKHLSIASSK